MENLVHDALLYRDADDFLAGTLDFIETGLVRGEPVLVATPPANLDRLRAALGPAGERVRMLDMCQVGRNPGRILPAVLLEFAQAHAGRPVRVIGEPIWAGRTPVEYPACVQHEALINAAFAGLPAMIRCPYDASGLDRQAIDDAERTHPRLAGADGSRHSVRYADPVATAADFNLPLPPPPATAVTIAVGPISLAGLRQHVADRARAAGLPPVRVWDATIAVNELVTNTIGHAAGQGTLASWRESGYLVYQLADDGHIADPLAGRLPPASDAVTGRGLFVVNQVCDLVRIHTEPGRTTIRIHLGPGGAAG